MKIKRSLIPVFGSGSALGADRSEVSLNEMFSEVNSCTGRLRKGGRRWITSLGSAVPEGKQLQMRLWLEGTGHTGPGLGKTG